MHGRHHRKERWLHTRISETLEDALKREARRRRLPVSLLVRNVLEGALDLVEDLVGGGLRGADPLDDVYGWQELIVHRATRCARCTAALDTGVRAFRGLREREGPPVFLCAPCVGRLGRRAGTPHGGA